MKSIIICIAIFLLAQKVMAGDGRQIEIKEPGAFVEPGPGIEVGGRFDLVKWDFSSAGWSSDSLGYEDEAFCPQMAFFYGINDTFDIRATLKWTSVQGEEEYVTGDMDVYRFGVGSKGWFKTGTEFVPFAAVGLNYYLVDVDIGDADDLYGLSCEGGVAYLINDRISVQVSIQMEKTLSDGSLHITENDAIWMLSGDDRRDLALEAVGVGLAMNAKF